MTNEFTHSLDSTVGLYPVVASRHAEDSHEGQVIRAEFVRGLLSKEIDPQDGVCTKQTIMSAEVAGNDNCIFVYAFISTPKITSKFSNRPVRSLQSANIFLNDASVCFDWDHQIG